MPMNHTVAARSILVCLLELGFVNCLYRRRGEREVLAVGLWIRNQDGDQTAIDRDHLVNHG
jgi:hypothetical protein